MTTTPLPTDVECVLARVKPATIAATTTAAIEHCQDGTGTESADRLPARLPRW